MNWIKHIDWPAWIGTLLLIIVFREAAVWIMTQLEHPELGNLVGLISLLIVLFSWRRWSKIPARLVDTNNKIMKESAFAFLPVSAGSLMMLVHMGHKIPAFLLILFVSTLIPLWVYAKMAKRWL
ncbi:MULTISPECIES: hypothetical protein [Acinetobacter]|jgi:hypothetical protein|uniref:LrgA family protein n=3 Tax=Acinetobacter schindleri TaxID=108981 RepID=N8Z427_9GAMM|nr:MULTISPECIES: hypothetical protein [Acinetobacter]AWD70603.1 hypothetical protein C0119_10330 [Acinetobacter schindleri]EIM39603.1 hypothetical protein HADU_05895 [Acinetobacter sp. HA]ENV11841.1 hypothetical protein F965_03333 [Acinetobacter schindleri NIPH 900]ENV43837.1 hypothetical protein F955_01716 [Acinetobacter schindleri CIP 107287]ENX02362.1 hypothetical protein F899_00888 [Acinetobacter sp. CIP 101934]